MTRYDSPSWSKESDTAAGLRARVDHLEERNRILAKSLSQSLNDLRSQMMNMNVEKVDSRAAAAMKQALTSVQSVQTCLEHPLAPLESTTNTETKEPRREKTDQPSNSGTGKLQSEQSSRSSSSEKPSRPDIKKAGGPTSMPLRQSPRPSLADSEFSWMLGGQGNRHLSSFVSSASEPPEQARQQNQALFGTDEEKKRSPAEPDGLAMRSFNGPEGLE